jgi:hypothetical protein
MSWREDVLKRLSSITAYFRHLTVHSALSPWVIGPAICILWIVILPSLKNRILRLIRRRLDGRHNWVWADSFLYALAPATTVVILASGFSLLQQMLPLNTCTDHLFDAALRAAIILALFLFAAAAVACGRRFANFGRRSRPFVGQCKWPLDCPQCADFP